MEQEFLTLRRIDFEFSINLKDLEKTNFKYSIGTKSTDEKEQPEIIFWDWGTLKKSWFYQKGHYWKIETEKPIIKSRQDLGIVDVKNKVFKIMAGWIGKQENDFKTSMKRIKHVLKGGNKPIPAQWTDIFFDWANTQKEISLDQFPEITPEVINDWVENNLPPHNEIIKNHSQKTRIDLEPKYKFYLMGKLGMIDPKGILFNTKLSLNDRAELLSKVLGYSSRECKDLLNGKTKFAIEKKSKLDDYLNELIQKSKK